MTNDEFISWLEEQAVWIKDAALIYYEKGEFTKKDIERFAMECIDETAGKKTTVDISKLNILARDNRSSFSIKSIDNVIGVNALTAGQSLEFGEDGITVVYGENGAGKSGYIRILKKLAGTKYKEDLRENVYFAKRNKQSCDVSVIREDKEERFSCDLSKDGEHPIFKDMDIFDTKVSKAYVEASKEVTYEPWVFSLLSAIAKIATEVKKEIEEKRLSLDASEIYIPDEFKETNVCKTVSEITEKIQLEDTFFEWNSELDEQLGRKEKESNMEAIIASINKLKKEIEQLEGLCVYIAQFEYFFSNTNIDELTRYRKELKIAKDEQIAAKVLFEKTADDLDKRSISNQAWINIWRSARNYYDTFLSHEGVEKYTKENGQCPLCGQVISDKKYVQRMQSIEEYVNGITSKKEDNIRKKLVGLLKKCPKSWGLEQCQLLLASAGVENIAMEILESLRKIDEISNLIELDEIEKIEIPEINIKLLLQLLENSIHEKSEMQRKQAELIGDDEHKKLIAEIKELKAQKYISGLRDKVNKRQRYLSEISLLDKAEKLTATNKISKQSTMLAKELLTDDYERRFNDELKLLTRGTVRAVIRQQKASKGKIPFKVELEDVEDKTVSPSEVLSEGENRVVSLAAFFAESSGRNVKCPLIVDDPISSLDYKYESSVIHRLVEAGKHRQVIVFTHRLSMVVGLYDECGNNVDFTEVELLGRGKKKGVPIASAFNGGKTLGKLKNLKNEKLAKLKKMDENTSEYIEGIHYVCQQIRIHVEKSIEDTLLNGIVLRYRKSVQTQNRIMWLSEITQDDCRIVDDMMTKYSYYDHSMSDEAPLQEFTLGEIEQDVDKLITWLTEISARKKGDK